MGRVEGMTFLYVVMLSPGTDYNVIRNNLLSTYLQLTYNLIHIFF